MEQKFSSPTVSLVIPTYNEEKRIGACLTSVFRQIYPKESLEVIVVDDKSDDRTIEIAKRFPVRILESGARHGEVSKMIGIKAAQGEFVIYLDADVELIGEHWIQKMLKPLLEDLNIIGSFTRKYSRKTDPLLERYLAFEPLQRDSLYQFFSPSILSTIVRERDGYLLCRYQEGNIPPAGRCLYRREALLKLISHYDMFLELDVLVLLVQNGLNTFAYVPEAGLYHHHAASLKELLGKRRYNVKRVYLGRQKRLYRWFDLREPKDIVKIIAWILYAHALIPSVVVGVWKSFRFRDWAGMYEPLVNFLVTDVILYTFLTDWRSLTLLEGEIS